MTNEEIKAWLEVKENQQLFRPTNRRPTSVQVQQVFQIANLLDPKGNHKPSGCGRCYSNALKAIERNLNIF